MRIRFLSLACYLLTCLLLTRAQENKLAAIAGSEYSGMYSFLREGEYVQIDIEDKGRVSGFISRYGDLDSDRDIKFLSHFFKEGKLEANKLTFTTETVHGAWFEFQGIVERGEGKKTGDEGFYILKGKLTEYSSDAAKKVTSRSREVVLKSFPHDLASSPNRKKD